MGLFDYLAPVSGDLPLRPGVRVRVPFGKGSRVGLVMGRKAFSDLPASRLRRIEAVLDREPLLPDDLLRLLSWASAYYQHPPGEVFATAIPLAVREGRWLAEGHAAFVGVTPAGREPIPVLLKRAPAQWRTFELSAAPRGCARGGSWTPSPGLGGARSTALIARGWWPRRGSPALEPVAAAGRPPMLMPTLTPSRSLVRRRYHLGRLSLLLLDGVTGIARRRSPAVHPLNAWTPPAVLVLVPRSG